MITEDYVSFEVAKLLKEKGFNEFTYSYYSKDDEESEPELCMENLCSDNWNGTPDEVNDLWFSAPTLSMTMKWLREEKDIYIQVMLDGWACGGHLGYYVVIQKTDLDFEMMLQDAVDEVFYSTYEEACEAAIKYCLENLI